MNIKSLLLGSAAALFAVSGAQAADAIIAAEPEPLEYVRVCDAFGTGYFYIPGTETCLKIGGYVRFQTTFGEDLVGSSDWDAYTRARLTVEASNDTELGTLYSFIAFHTDAETGAEGDMNTYIDEAYFELAGFKVGNFFSWWDDGISGETDTLGTNTRFNSVAYIYDAGNFFAGISVDEIEQATTSPNGIGIAATASATLGGVTLSLLGGYDTEVESGAIRAILAAEVGPGVFELAGIYAFDEDDIIAKNAYYNESEWTVAAAYDLRASERLTITPAAQYFGSLNTGGPGYDDDVDAFAVGLTAEYAVTEGLGLLATVDYTEVDGGADDGDDSIGGFLRLQRNF